MRIREKLLSVTLLLLIVCVSIINFSKVAGAASAFVSTSSVVLGTGQKDFTLDLSVNNDGKPYSGAEFGLRLNGIELTGIKYNVADYGQEGPVIKDGVTYFGFFNANNAYSDGKVCTLTLRYTGQAKVTMVLEHTQVSTRISANNVSGDKKNPQTQIVVSREQAGSLDNNNNNTSNSQSGSQNTTGNTSTSSTSTNTKSPITLAPTDMILTEDVVRLLTSTSNDIVVNLTKPDVISKDIFTAIQGKDQDITFNVQDNAAGLYIRGHLMDWT